MSSILEYLLHFPPSTDSENPSAMGFGFAIVKAAFHVSALMTLSRWLGPFRDRGKMRPWQSRQRTIGETCGLEIFCGALSQPRPDCRLQVMANKIWQSPVA